jgi:hypothetical protein
MSDPYNSHGTMLPPVTAAPGVATPRLPVDRISRLDVSEGWKEKFRLIEKAGGAGLPRFRDLPFGERMAVNTNWLAFFFGIFYLLAKGMWRPAISIFVIASAIFAALEMMGFGGVRGGVAVGVMCSMGANRWYYRQVVLGERPWF